MTKLFASLGLVVCAGCAADSADDETSETTAAVISGTTGYAGDCTTEMRAFLDKSRRHERAILGSRAFEQCVDQGARNGIALWPGASVGPYQRCAGDAFFTSSLDSQIKQALSIARATNDVAMTC